MFPMIKKIFTGKKPTTEVEDQQENVWDPSPISLISTGKDLRSFYRINKPGMNIPGVGGLYSMETSEQEIPLKKSHLEAKVFNSAVNIKYSQTYNNDSKKPIEVVYKFPADDFFSVTGFKIKMDDKEIDTQIMEKEEAKQKYDDQVAQGNTAAKINYDENVPEVLELVIGAIQPKKQVDICVEIVSKCKVLKDGTYSFIFPINFIPGVHSSKVTQNMITKSSSKPIK
jgi:hypothetical protein